VKSTEHNYTTAHTTKLHHCVLVLWLVGEQRTCTTGHCLMMAKEENIFERMEEEEWVVGLVVV